MKLCTHAKLNFFEIELIICIKMDLALDKEQMLICHKPQNQPLFDAARFQYSQVFVSFFSSVRSYSFLGGTVRFLPLFYLWLQMV